MMNAPTTSAIQTSTVKVVVNERTLWVAWEAMRAERAAAVRARPEGPTTACSRAASGLRALARRGRDQYFADPTLQSGQLLGHGHVGDDHRSVR